VRRSKIYLDWEIGYSNSDKGRPEEWVKAAVPGAVQLDWAVAKGYSDYRISDNYKQCLWMEDKYWIYKTSFELDNISDDRKYFFISKGIDYEFEIIINDKKLFYQEGMYKPVELNLTDYLSEQNELMIRIYPVPKTHNSPVDHHQVSQSCKPAASYGWDWHPRLIPLGIWDATFLEIRPSSYIKNVVCNYEIEDDLRDVNLKLDIYTINTEDLETEIIIKSPNEEILKFNKSITQEVTSFSGQIKNALLWYPIGYGPQNLYEIQVQLISKNIAIDSFDIRTGFRRARLIMNHGAWNVPDAFPKTRSVPPMQMEINGINVFCKGSNWVMPEIFYGTISKERYREMVDLAIECNFNIFRIWGGGIINKESFYEYCDEKGIMVWQEFPLACTNYIDSEKYLSVLESEAKAIIKRLKDHSCIVLWCGGNELFNSWSGMTEQSLALRLLNKICYEEDQKTPFIYTSPIMGVGHGHYVFYDFKTNESVFELYTKHQYTGMTEYGVGAASSVETLKRIIPEEELWPPVKDGAWKDHHGFSAWDGENNAWLNLNVIENYFGPQKDLSQMVENSQLLQAVGLQFIYEESRRMQPYCSMTLNWCFNDCWPAAANTSIIEYPNKPKKAYYSIKDALRPVVASARIKKFMWQSYEDFEVDLFLLNDSLNLVEAGKMIVSLEINNERIKVFEWNYEAAEKQFNISGPTIHFKLPQLKEKRFYLLMEDEVNPSIKSTYLLFSAL
jgi:beta-mannosidase